MDSNQSVSLSPTQATPHPSSTASAGISSIPIRAPLSSDSDFESALKTHSRNNSNGSSISGTSAKSFVSEEEEEDGFLSGEDGFETADEKHYEENLESAMEGEDILAKPALGSSRFSIAPPKARISADFDEDDDEDEVVDDGVEVPKGGVLEGGDDSEKIQIQDHSLIENGVVPGNPVLGSGELVEEKAPDVDEALVEDKLPDAAKALAEEKVPDVVEAGNLNFADSVENGVLENGGKKDSMEEKPVLDSGSVTVDGEVDAVSEVSEEPLVAHKEDILPESPKLDKVVNPEIEELQEEEEVDTKPEPVEIGGEEKEEVDTKPEPVEIGGVEEKEEVDTKVEPVHKEVEEVPVEALVPDKHDDDILLDFPKLDAVVTGEFEVQEKKEVEPVPEKEIEEVPVEPLPEKKEYKDVLLTGLKLDVAENPEIGIQEKEEVETKVEAVDQKESEEVSDEAVVENKETMVPQMNSVANTEVEAQEKETETEDEAVQVKENVEVPNESIVPPVADKEDILQEGPKLDVIVQAKEDVETNVEALQKGSEEEVSGIKDEVDENKIEALSSSVDQPSPEDAVQVDSMLVTADKEVISTSEEASAVATETVPLVPTPVGVPDATPDVKPLEAEIGSPLPATTEETDISEVAESGVDIVEEDGPSSELRVSEKIPDLVEEDGPSGELSVSEKIPDLVENSAIETRELEQQDSKMQLLSSESNDAGVASQDDELKQSVSETPDISETTAAVSNFDSDVKEEAEAEVGNLSDYQEGEGSSSDEDNDELNFGSSGTAEQIMKELMRGSGVSFRSGAESSQDGSQRNDGQILMDSDEEVDTDEEGEGKELFDSAALAALLKAATSAGPEGGNVTITQDGSRLFNVERPAGLGSSMRSLKPTSQPSRPNIFTSSEVMAGGESENLSEEDKKKLEKLQHLRVKFLRLIHRLGHSPDEAIAAQVLYRMVLAAGRQTGQAFSLETAKKTATQLEAENADDLDFSLNILVLGKTGVGKSATINSIFGEEKAKIGAFEPSTTAVREITGTVGGVKIRILDTPGLKSSLMEQTFNRKVLSSVKKLTKKFPLDILLYVDRLDTQTRDLNDLPLLRAITNTLGSSIWRSAVVTLTHAASAPPDGPTGSPLSYEVFVAQRSHIIQQSIGQAVGDLRMMNPSLMNPVSLVENHPSCRKNREGQKILPNGQVWRPQLLLLCYSLKVLSEVTSLSKPQDPFDHRKLFGFRVRAPPLPYLLSSLLQSRAHPKLPDDQGGDNVDSDVDLEDLSDSDREEEEDEYDQLPPFKPLRKAQIAKLSKDQKKAYFDEYDYRVKLLQKKQWKEELKRMKEMKKRGKGQKDDFANVGEDAEQEQEGPAAVPVPLPDMVLPPSFDGDNPAYRYRFLEPTSQLLARPVLDTHGWDHDCGYDGVSLEENLAIAGRFPGGVAVQITKDKKEFNIHLDSSIAAKHGENGSSLAGFDIQTIGKQLGYIIRGETKFKNFKKNKTTGGVSVTFLGENVATGVKVEDQISIGKRLTLVASTGTIRSQGDAAYGANLEATLKDKDFPIGQDQSTLGLSLMRWRGDLALGANLQSQFAIGRGSKMSVRLGLNNKLSGQITVRTSSSEQLQLALVGLLPIAISLYRSIWPSTGESFSAY